jgi:hypothetical protein
LWSTYEIKTYAGGGSAVAQLMRRQVAFSIFMSR